MSDNSSNESERNDGSVKEKKTGSVDKDKIPGKDSATDQEKDQMGEYTLDGSFIPHKPADVKTAKPGNGEGSRQEENMDTDPLRTVTTNERDDQHRNSSPDLDLIRPPAASMPPPMGTPGGMLNHHRQGFYTSTPQIPPRLAGNVYNTGTQIVSNQSCVGPGQSNANSEVSQELANLSSALLSFMHQISANTSVAQPRARDVFPLPHPGVGPTNIPQGNGMVNQPNLAQPPPTQGRKRQRTNSPIQGELFGGWQGDGIHQLGDASGVQVRLNRMATEDISSQVNQNLSQIRQTVNLSGYNSYSPVAHTRLQNIDQEVCTLLGMTHQDILSCLYHDYSVRLTKGKATEILSQACQVFNAPGGNLLSTSLCGLIDQIRDVENIMSISGSITGPAEWRAFAHILAALKAKAESTLINLRDRFDQSRSNTSRTTTNETIDFQNKYVLREIQPWSGKNIDLWLDHFERLTNGLGIEHKKLLLGSKIGPENYNRTKDIESMYTWQDVKRHVIQELSECKNEVSAAFSLREASQGSDPIQVYHDRIKLLITKMGRTPDTVSDVFIMSNYTHGLSDHRQRRRCVEKMNQAEEDSSKRITVGSLMKEVERMERTNATLGVHAGTHDPGNRTERVNAARSCGNYISDGSMIASAYLGIVADKFIGDVMCNRHDYSTHSNAQCKAPKGECMYCKMKGIPDKDFISGAHKKVCKAVVCKKCTKRGHTEDRCYKGKPPKSNFNAGRRSNAGNTQKVNVAETETTDDQGVPGVDDQDRVLDIQDDVA